MYTLGLGWGDTVFPYVRPSVLIPVKVITLLGVSNIARHFMRIICLAGDSHEMSNLTLSEK